MQIKSVCKYARVSAFKAREVTRVIQGLFVQEALDLLRLVGVSKKSSSLVFKTLKSATANAENNHNLDIKDLFIKEAVVGEGPTLKRFQPKARGSAGPIRKRTSHITIILTNEVKRSPKKNDKSKKRHTKKKGHQKDSSASVTISSH